MTKTLSVVFAAVAAVVLSALPAVAGEITVPLPEPGTLTLLSSALGAGVLGYRWFRRR